MALLTAVTAFSASALLISDPSCFFTDSTNSTLFMECRWRRSASNGLGNLYRSRFASGRLRSSLIDGTGEVCQPRSAVFFRRFLPISLFDNMIELKNIDDGIARGS